MSAPPAGAALRVAFAADDPEHEEARAIAAWLRGAPGFAARPVELRTATITAADVLWIHGVRPVPLEALGPDAPQALLRGGVLLTGGAATLPSAGGVDPSAPNDVGRDPWPALPDDDGLPPLRGHASFRAHPLFDGLGATALTCAPAAGQEHVRVGYVLPSWPGRGRVVAMERTRLRIVDRATIWEYDGEAGRTICIGSYLPLDGRDPGLHGAATRLAANALKRAARPPEPAVGSEPGEWRRPEQSAVEDRTLAMPELPLMEELIGPMDFRLRGALSTAGDAPFHVAGRRAFVAGGAARGTDEVWTHPFRLAAGLRVRGGRAMDGLVTPVGVERRVSVEGETILERIVVSREAPFCLFEWLSRTRTVEIEVGWTCDLRLAGPYPAGSTGGLRWRRAARGAIVGAAGEERAAFAFSALPEELEIIDASERERPLVRLRARLRLLPRVPVRLVMAGAAGDAALKRALAAADRSGTVARSRHGHAERLMADYLALDTADPAEIQAVEWAKHRLDACLAEAPGLGRSLLSGYAGAPEAPFDENALAAARFAGPDGVRGALACLAWGNAAAARDVLGFLGRHQDPAGRVLHDQSTSGFARHDSPPATYLYLLLAARYLAWTGDLRTLQAEWRRVLRAYDAALGLDAVAAVGGADRPLLAAALAELAEAAESIGERGAAVELGEEAARRGGQAWALEIGARTPVVALVHGLLGTRPDAPRGRLVLRPTPPAAWRWFGISGLRIGDASVRVDYRRGADGHTFRLTQQRGGAPLRVILEPAVPGRRLRSAMVDGEPAELDPRRRGERIEVPVQVVLDHARELVLAVDG